SPAKGKTIGCGGSSPFKSAYGVKRSATSSVEWVRSTSSRRFQSAIGIRAFPCKSRLKATARHPRGRNGKSGYIRVEKSSSCQRRDRKSTRLNSSHVKNSYA